MLDLLALIRFHGHYHQRVLKVAVKGNVTMLMIMRKIRTALASVAEGGSLPPVKM